MIMKAVHDDNGNCASVKIYSEFQTFHHEQARPLDLTWWRKTESIHDDWPRKQASDMKLKENMQNAVSIQLYSTLVLKMYNQ